jgi:hypothetical protein
VLAVGFLGAAAVVTPRAWQDRPLMRRGTRSEAAPSPGELKSRRFRTRLLEVNPFFWLATRPQSRIWHVWGGFGVLGVVWVWGIFKFQREWFNIGIYVATSYFLNSMLKVWVASEACRQIAAERKHGTLELLLATPLSVKQIIEGQRLALQRHFGLPILVALVLEAIMLSAALREGGLTGRDQVMWVWLWLLAMGLLVLDAVTFFWTGLWAGLTARDARRAYTRVISTILVLPWVLYAGFLGALGAGAFGPAHEVTWVAFVAVWFLLNLSVDVWFGLSARAKLQSEFRQRATERFQSR